MKKFKKILKKMIITVLVLLLCLVIGFGIFHAPLLYFVGYMYSAKNIDYEFSYHTELKKEKLNFVLETFATAQLDGEMRNWGEKDCFHSGGFYLKNEDVPLVKYYQNATDSKYDIGQIRDYILNLLNEKTKIPFNWITNTFEKYYITNEQIDEIFGTQIPTIVLTDKKVLLYPIALLTTHTTSAPAFSEFRTEIEEMKFYEYEISQDEILTIGFAKNFDSKVFAYVRLENTEQVMEGLLECRKVDRIDKMEIPEGELTEQQMEIIKWIYDYITKAK